MSKLELSINKLEVVTLRVQPEGYVLTLRLKVLAMQVGLLWPWMDLQKAGTLKLTLESAQLVLPLPEAEERRPDTMEDFHVEIPPAAQEEKPPAAAPSSRPLRGRNPKSPGDLCHIFPDGALSACGRHQLREMADVVPYSGNDDLYNPICRRCVKALSKAEAAPTASA